MFRKYPSLFLLIFVVVGIVTADRWRLPSEWWLAICVLSALAGILMLFRSRSVPAGFLLGLSLGAAAGLHFSVRVYDPGPDHFSRVVEAGKKYVIYGRVTDWPDLKPDRTEIKISLDSLGSNEVLKVSGDILLKISDTTTALQRGDRVKFIGRIYPVTDRVPKGRFNYQRHLKLRGVFGIVYLTTANEIRFLRRGEYGFWALTDRLRETIKNSFYRNLSPRSAALASGFLIGETRNIPPDIYRMFRDSGTLHLLAVSGSNVALVVLFIIWFLRPFRLSRHKRYLILLAVIIVFTVLSYGEPSVVRASLMAVLVIGAVFFQRRYDLNHIIALAAFIILMVEPAQLFEVGFQLSFVTAWGLIFVMPILAERFKPYHGRKWYRWLVFPVLISLVAQVCSTPIIACYFGRLPVIGVFANLVIVPLVSAAVLGIMILLAANLILPLLGQAAGALLNVLLDLIVELLHGLGGDNIPILSTGNLLTSAGSTVVVLAVYGLLWVAVSALRKKAFRKITLLYALLFVNSLLVWYALADEDRTWPRLTVTSVPGGVAALVRETDNGVGTLLVSDLRARSYPVDESILNPFLEGAGLDRLDGVVALSLDYHAIDDLIRTALKYRTRYLYINRTLRASFADVIALNFSDDDITFELIEFGSAEEDNGEEGIFPGRDMIRLVSSDRRVLLLDEPGLLPDTCPGDGRENWLIIGRKWYLTKSDLTDLYRRGYSRIICSKIELLVTDRDTIPAIQSENLPRFFLYDIDKQGPVILSL